MKVYRETQANGSVDPGHLVVGHDTPAAGKIFETAAGEGFGDIEEAEEEEGGEEEFPIEDAHAGEECEGGGVIGVQEEHRGNRGQAQEKYEVYSGDFVDDDVLWIFHSGKFGNLAARLDPKQSEE